jgi:hypothetical protein
MSVIVINSLSEIEEKIGETKIGQTYPSCVWLLLVTKRHHHLIVKDEREFQKSGNYFHTKFEFDQDNPYSAEHIYRKKQKRTPDEIYWEIYDEMIDEMGLEKN